MPDTNLNQIFEAIGGLTEQVKGLRRDVQDDRETAAKYRHGMRKELKDIASRTASLESDMKTVKERTHRVETVTDDVVEMRARAQGAGALGRVLLRAGLLLLSAASGAAGVWYAMTGRPPP